MLKVAKLTAWSVRYYESTAVRGHEHGGGLAEYYSEADTRAPMVLVAGDRAFAEEAMGIRHGEEISAEEVTRWFTEGIAPSGAAPGGHGGARAGEAVSGWDLLFTVPKSVSVQAALTSDERESKVIMDTVRSAAVEALQYLHKHAGYTRVTNAEDKSKKDLQQLPALPVVAYMHQTARPVDDGTCDPHIHIHALLPGKIARADGRMVSIDSRSMHYELKTAGTIFQKLLRDTLSRELGYDWHPVDPDSGIAEISGYSREMIKPWSRRSSALMEWAKEHLGNALGLDEHADEQAAARAAREQLGYLHAAQKATRNKKLETLSYAELRDMWRADPRAAAVDVERFRGALQHKSIAERSNGAPPTAQEVFGHLSVEQNSWTRSHVAQAVAKLWSPGDALHVITLGEIEDVTDQIIDAAGFQIVADRKPWEREGHTRWADEATLRREASVMQMWEESSRNRQVFTTAEVFANAGLKHGAAEAMAEIANSKRMIQVLEAPAGAGKTTSLKALRTHVEDHGYTVRLITAARTALKQAQQAEAASEYNTIASTLLQIENDTLNWDSKSLVVVDEAGMAGDRDLQKIIEAVRNTGGKILLIGDSWQLQPVKAGGGLFRDLAENLPWAQSLDYVWRQVRDDEKAATLGIRNAQTGAELEKVADWYADNDRLRAGDHVTMSQLVIVDYFDNVAQGNDTIILADRWEVVDALNLKIQTITNHAYREQHGTDRYGVNISRDHTARIGDLILTQMNDYDIEVTPAREADPDRPTSAVTNKDRWQVIDVDTETGRLHAQRLDDKATAWLPVTYAREHVVLGYAGTMHGAQGATAKVGLGIGSAETMTKTALYPAITRGTHDNRLYMTVKVAGQDEHHNTIEDAFTPHELSTAAARELMLSILGRDDREETALAAAEAALEAIKAGGSYDEHAAAFGGQDPAVADLIRWRSELRVKLAGDYRREHYVNHNAELVAAQQRADRSRTLGREIDYSRIRDDDYDISR